MRLLLVTGNENKVKEFSSILGFAVDHDDYDYPEIRAENCEDVVKEGALHCAKRFDRPVIVEDSGLFIDALDGFPGAFTKYVWSKIGNEGILRIMKNIDNRKCWYRSAVAIAFPDGNVKVFSGYEEGIIAHSEKGRYGWGQDPIFIPKGYDETYGELKGKGISTTFRRIAVEKLKEFLKHDNLI